jgi:hypothetical protein
MTMKSKSTIDSLTDRIFLLAGVYLAILGPFVGGIPWTNLPVSTQALAGLGLLAIVGILRLETLISDLSDINWIIFRVLKDETDELGSYNMGTIKHLRRLLKLE